MSTTQAQPQKISVTDFKAHCTEYLRAIENGAPPIQITRHGKVVAEIKKPEVSEKKPITLADWIGGGRGSVVFSPDNDPHAPAFEDDEWETLND